MRAVRGGWFFLSFQFLGLAIMAGRILLLRTARAAPAFVSPAVHRAGGRASSSSVMRRWAATVTRPSPSVAAPSAVSVQDLVTSLPKDLPEPEPLRADDDSSGSSSGSATGVGGFDYQPAKVSEDGLPLTYDPVVIQRFWDARPAEMQRRWGLFISVTAPFLTGLLRSYTAGTLLKNERQLARDLRIVLEKLGPTFVKLGQALSIRPDVVGPAATEELAKLQDAVPPFSHELALSIMEAELGRPVDEVFTDLSPQPIAAASLAQVYKARLRESGEWVAVKVQRPDMLETVSKDLYVMRRAVEVYQKYIVERFTAQKTDYQQLLKVWAEGFYRELDFLNEAASQRAMKEALSVNEGIYVPAVYSQYSTRRLLVTEWIDGIKLSQAPKEEIRRLTRLAQECFLRQLLELGYFHADPHPGNLMILSDKSKGELAILDFGLMANIDKQDMETMVNALVHTANKDFGRLIDDLIDLNVLPPDTDRAKVEPVMRRVIGPYVFQGGGAKNLNYQSLAKDLTAATLEIPFTIPPYFALIARALGVLEGIALTGDPDYRIVMESYPYVSRRLLTEDSPRLQRALNDILYGKDAGQQISFRRLSALVAYAMNVKESEDGNNVDSVFVDFDRLPSTAMKLNDTVSFLLGQKAAPIRSLLVDEAASASDLLLRQQFRRAAQALHAQLPRPPVPPFFPRPPPPPFPTALVDSIAPPLSLEEEVFLASLTDLAYALAGMEGKGRDPMTLLRPEQVLAWLQGVDAKEAADLAVLLDPRTATGANLLDFGGKVVERLADRARPRLERALATATGTPSPTTGQPAPAAPAAR